MELLVSLASVPQSFELCSIHNFLFVSSIAACTSVVALSFGAIGGRVTAGG